MLWLRMTDDMMKKEKARSDLFNAVDEATKACSALLRRLCALSPIRKSCLCFHYSDARLALLESTLLYLLVLLTPLSCKTPPEAKDDALLGSARLA